jgi:hypothetical protein
MSKTELYARDMSGVAWRKSSRSEVDLSECVEVAFLDSGGVALRDSNSPSHPEPRFTGGEWSAFTAGDRRGEFDG